MNLVVCSAYAGSLSFSEFAQMASWSMAVPTLFQSMTFRSDGW